jgi:hypothetical protein
MDEETMQRPLREIEMLDLALPKIPTKALYKLQVSVVQEIQSRARSDATNLQLAQEDNTSLKEALSQEGKEKKMVHNRRWMRWKTRSMQYSKPSWITKEYKECQCRRKCRR